MYNMHVVMMLEIVNSEKISIMNSENRDSEYTIILAIFNSWLFISVVSGYQSLVE